MLVEFDAVLMEIFNIIPLLFHLCQVVTDTIDRLGKGDILELSLLSPVVDNELRLDDSHRHLHEVQPECDFASRHLVGVDELLISISGMTCSSSSSRCF